ncbi:MAG: hypothetical protein EOP16_00475 [Pseudonocardia sp.]|nr:MAG: hypothetical protein EOP16_00475 [Pseudonocardia sp.]
MSQKDDGSLAVLVLESLHCQITDDVMSDEPAITVNGDEVWRAADVDEGDTRAVDVRRTFVNVAIVELRDSEPPGVADDNLGSKIVESSEAGLGQRQAFFNQGTARYILRYHVE